MTCAYRPLKLLATAGALATVLGITANAATAGPSYEMISYLDSPSGRRLAAADYDGAIRFAQKSARGPSEKRLIENTNLCVAYTVTRSYAKARDHCEAALEIAKLVDEDRSRWSIRSEHETAKAMTNRGVLRAMSGDMTGAASDFRNATAMSGAATASDRNLVFLEGVIADRLAMTEAR